MNFIFFVNKQDAPFHQCQFCTLFHTPLLYFIISVIYLFICLIILLSRFQPFLACLLYRFFFFNWYIIFSDSRWYHLFLVSHISWWQISRHNLAWISCSFRFSGFVIYTQRFLLYHTWLVSNKCKSRDEVIIIHDVNL